MRWGILLMVGLLGCSLARAHLVVVNTDGPIVDAAPYVKSIHYPRRGGALSMLHRNKIVFHRKKIQIQRLMYPATSDLTAGRVKSHPQKSTTLARSIFVIGDDPLSIGWAKTNATELKKCRAIGIITNVESYERVQMIENETGLTLFPASVSELSDYLQVSHYPFLWTKSDVEQ
jgi:integrating conjugative element protein (TIGR03765 family)